MADTKGGVPQGTFDVGSLPGKDDEGEWYTIPNSHVRVRVRKPRPKRRRDLVRLCTVRKVRGGRYVESLDDEKFNRLLLNECVLGWEGIVKNGEPFPVTEENKVFLDDNWTEFNALWTSVLGTLADVDAAIREAEEKN